MNQRPRQFLPLFRQGLLVVCFFLPAGLWGCGEAPPPPADMSGQWRWNTGWHSVLEPGGQPKEELKLYLQQSKEKISGNHCAIARWGQELDIPARDESIVGTVEGHTAEVTFHSACSPREGRARLTLRNGKLYWQIIEGPAMHHLPERAILQRMASK